MGHCSNPWGIFKTLHRGVPGNSRRIHGETPQASIADVADIPEQSCQGLGLHRLFILPTATFRVLFVLVVDAYDCRRVVHFNVTKHPTAYWTAERIIQRFPAGSEPRFLLLDYDGIYGKEFQNRFEPSASVGGGRGFEVYIALVISSGRNLGTS